MLKMSDENLHESRRGHQQLVQLPVLFPLFQSTEFHILFKWFANRSVCYQICEQKRRQKLVARVTIFSSWSDICVTVVNEPKRRV